MKAIILSAAKPSFSDDPICNITIKGEILLDIQISTLRKSGIEDIYVVTGYRSEDIHRADINTLTNHDWANTGSISSIKIAKEMLNGDEDILICYGDTLFEAESVQGLQRSTSGMSVLCFMDRAGHDEGNFREYALIKDGRLALVTDNPPSSGVRTVFTGMVLVKKDKAVALRNHLDENRFNPLDHIGALVNHMITMGSEFLPVIIEHGWVEMTSVNNFEQMLQDAVFIEKVIQIHTDWTKRSQRYDKLAWVNNDTLLREIVAITQKIGPDRVLDLGTGTGKVIRAIRESGSSSECWGLDYSQAMLNKMEDTNNIQLICGNAESMPEIPSNYFDLVTARMVFHHIFDSKAALKEVSRVLSPGGSFLICEGVPPTIRSIEWYTKMFRYKEDRKTLSEVDLINMLLAAGCESIDIKSVIIRRASLNNWLDNSGIPEENIKIIKEMHYDAPAYIKEDYGMQFENDDCYMTWRFAIAYGRMPDAPVG